MPKWEDESCSICGKAITSRMKPYVLNDQIACQSCWRANSPEPPTERQVLFAKNLGIDDAEFRSREDLSVMIDEAKSRRNLAKDAAQPLGWYFTTLAGRICAVREIASGLRLARISYHKVFDDPPESRVVEPYQLHASRTDLYLLAWQVEPLISEPTSWRHFRIDRMLSIEPVEQRFVPRSGVTLPDGAIHQFNMDDGRPDLAEVIGDFRPK